MRRMTVCAAYIVAPVLATSEIIVLFLAGMTGKTGLRDCLGGFVLERNDLRRIAVFYVGLAGTVARLTTSNLSFPAAYG